MTRTPIPFAAVTAALCLVGLLAGCSASDSATNTGGARSAASNLAPTAPTSATATAAPVVATSTGAPTPSTGSPADTSAAASTMAYAGPAVTLTIGTDDSPGKPSADEITHFADTVKSLSGGKITITPKWNAEGDGGTTWDQKIAAMVQKGQLDLALGPTWAWDVLGVDTLEPIQTPFLIDSDALVAKVITDQDLSTQLMSGLPEAGVTGLSLWPEGLRHPFGFETPLLTPADYRGQTIRSPESALSTKIFAALGAKTSAEEPDATTMAGMQSEYALSPNGAGATNITFFPKINVLYANTDSYAKLSDDAKNVLATAATDTQTWAIARTHDADAGRDFCSDDGTLVLADSDDVAALIDATAPVAQQIKTAHPDQVATITALKKSTPNPTPGRPCSPTATSVTSHAPGAAEAALNGTYRFTITADEFAQAGFDDQYAFNNAGVQTFVMKNGRVAYHLDPSERPFAAVDSPGGADETDGSYQVDGDAITFRFPAYDNEVDQFTVSQGQDGDLHLVLVETNAPTPESIDLLMASKVWERIK